MTQFPTAGHLASWAGQCPGNDQSAGKRRSGRTRKGSKNLNIALKDAAMAALRTNDSYLQALYRRKRTALGHGRAVGAVKHSMICACWHMLATGKIYSDLGSDYYQRRDPQRRPGASSHNSNASDTPSPSKTPQPRRASQRQADLSAAPTLFSS
jgi:transposase